MPLLPWEFDDLRNLWISSKSLWSFELYLFTLLCSRLALRESECESIQIASFDMSISRINANGVVDFLAVTIMGKSDNQPVTLLIYRDDVRPDWCLVRHILVWLYVTGISSGYLFPSRAYLQEKGVSLGHVPDSIGYSTFLKELVAAIKMVVHEGRGPWGTHTCRKIFYLIGLFLGIELEVLMRDARHSTLKSALVYAQDASKTYLFFSFY